MNKQDNVPQVKTVESPYQVINNFNGHNSDSLFTGSEVVEIMNKYADKLINRITELEASNAKYREALESITKTDCPMNQAMCGMIDCNCKVVGKSNDVSYKKALKDIAMLKYNSTIHPTAQGKAAIAMAEQALNSKEVG